MFDNVITVFKFVSDLHFYVTGTQDENELILVTVLQALFDAISLLLRCAASALPPHHSHLPAVSLSAAASPSPSPHARLRVAATWRLR